MILGLARRALRSFFDPTAKWPPHMRQELTYDLRSRAINGLKLGAPFEEARSFGRCDDYNRYSEFLDLFYRPSGLGLQFGDRQLIGVVLVVSKEAYPAQRHKLEVCWPVVVDLAGRRHRFSETRTLDDVVACFGQPTESDSIGEEMLHSFVVGKNFVEAYHHPETGRLLHMEIFEANEVV